MTENKPTYDAHDGASYPIKLVVFDCDGTLTRTKSGATFRRSADDWELLPGRAEKLAELKAQEIRIAMASNQGGVAFGYLDQREIMLELHKTAEALNIPPGGVYICYNHPNASLLEYKYDDYRRKPGPGMIEDAMGDFESSPEETLVVGDREEDQQSAENAGCYFCWASEYFGGER